MAEDTTQECQIDEDFSEVLLQFLNTQLPYHPDHLDDEFMYPTDHRVLKPPDSKCTNLDPFANQFFKRKKS